MPSLTGGTVALGESVVGSTVVASPWTQVTASLDVTALTALDLRLEQSVDGGATWQPLASANALKSGVEARTGLPIGTATLRYGSALARPSGTVRLVVTNSAAFLSSGGTLTVT